MRKTQVNIEEMHRISCSCVSLTRRANKLDEMGTTSKMHPRIKTRAHLSADQRKAGPGERYLVSHGSPTSIPDMHSTTS